MSVLTLKAKHDHLEKVATSRDPVKALAEFVWNALDADAQRVSVEFEKNGLGGLEGIVIRDSGSGISKARAEHDFESLGESWKLKCHRTPILSHAIHGKEGQGRLKFFSLAKRAQWNTVYEEKKKLFSLTIKIDAASLQTSDVSDPMAAPSGATTGTIVELSHLKDTFDWLPSEGARAEFDAIFSLYVLQYPGTEIIYNGHPVDPNTTIERTFDFPLRSVICPNRTIKDMSLKVVEWKSKAGNRKIYFGGESGVVLGSQAANITAPGYDFSVYAYSPFFQEIADANLLEFEGLNDADFAAVLDYIRDQVGDYFRIRQAEKSSGLIQDLIDAGIYPYADEPKNEVERRERQVFDIATHAVSSYSKDFRKADNSLKKITLGLLREAVQHNPDSVSRILRAVFNLPKGRQDEFSALLGKTELGHIISASSLIADRVVALRVLSEIVFDPTHRKAIKERGELDVLMRDNTWVFGENFHITMAEAGLTKVMNRVSDELALKREKGTKGRKPNGKVGRIDSFMGRVVPNSDRQYREFLLVELKRPSLVVGRTELDQLEDYVNSMLSQPDFINTRTFWNFYLVSGEYDGVVRERITQKERPIGLFLDKPNHRVWVKSWAELIRDCESRLEFVQEKLQIQVSAEEIESRISTLKASILKHDTDQRELKNPMDSGGASPETMPAGSMGNGIQRPADKAQPGH
jgi:hypothetical protein